MKLRSARETSGTKRLLAKAWFGLTEQERWAIMLVLGLFLLGLGARAWHLSREISPASQPPPMTRNSEP